MQARARARRIIFILLVLALTLLPLQASLAQDPDLRTVTIVSTNDLHGGLTAKNWTINKVPGLIGGAEWLAGYLNVVRQENPGGVLYLDAGDLMQGTLISNYWWGAPTIEAMNETGLAALTLGNHEFDWGQAVLGERAEQADFPFLAANIFYKKDAGNPEHGHGGRPHWAKPYVVREVNGVRVGIIGVANPDTPTLTNPVNVADLMFTDPVEAVNEALPEAEAEGATFIVVAAHLGGFYPDFNGGIKQLACSLDPEKVDLIVSGHSHSRINDVICGIPVVQAYSSGTAFSRVDFTVDAATGEATSYVMNAAPTNTTHYFDGSATYHGIAVVPDPEVKAILDVYAPQIEEIRSRIVGETSAPLTRNYRYESAMGDWVADVMRAVDPNVDFAFTNSGGLRTDLDAGPITFGEVFDIMPFDNTQVVVELTGSEVRQVLEEGITGQHGLIQVSGLRFTFDYGLPAGSRIIGDVIDLSTGLPLDPNATYYVAVNDFMANGGDHYATLAANPQTNTYVLVRDILVNWLGGHSPFTPPDPAVEQRITALGTAPA